MELKSKAEINIDDIRNSNINISNLDYMINLKTNNIGIKSKKIDEEIPKTGIEICSSYGPLDVSIDILTQDINDINTDKLDFTVNGKYSINENLKIGLKYETDMKDDGYEILSGTINTNIKTNQVNLKLDTENILFGSKKENDVEYSICGNTINPSIGNDNISIGYKYKNIEKTDETGNKEEKEINKICGNIDLSLMH